LRIGVDQLIDRVAVRDVLTRYCRAIDRCDATLLGEQFHPDAFIDHPPLPQDAAGFCREVIRLVRDTGPSLHYMTNVLIEIEEGTAYTEAYFTAWHRISAEESGGVFTSATSSEHGLFGGRYVNWLSAPEGTWRISKHTTMVEWESWIPADERTDLVSIGRSKSRRDTDDVSYARGRFPGDARG
jgi:hypothetical protein